VNAMRVEFVSLILGVLAHILFVPSVYAQQQPREEIPFEGTQAFSQLLRFHQLEPLKQAADLQKTKPADTLIVVFGDTDALDDIQLQIGSLRTFQQAGGAILIASDRPSHGRLGRFGLRIDGAQVREHPGWAYKNTPQYPFVQRGRDHPIFRDVRGIATNGPSFIEYRAFNPLQTLGEFSHRSFLGDRRPLPHNSAFMLGTPGWNDSERVLILAGHSVFMNGLLGQPDNDNFVFAYNCVSWLSRAPDNRGGRRYVYFVENGSVVDKLDVPLTTPVPPPLPPVAIVNRMLHKIEEENLLYRILYGDDHFPGLVTREQVLSVIILALSAFLLIYGGRRLMHALQRTDTAVPLPQAWSQQRLADPALIVRRHREVRSLNNYRESAQFLCQQFFTHVLPGDTSFDVGRTPRLRFVGAGWWLRRRWTRAARRLWQLGCGEVALVGPVKLRQALRTMDELAIAVQQGRLHFDPA